MKVQEKCPTSQMGKLRPRDGLRQPQQCLLPPPSGPVPQAKDAVSDTVVSLSSPGPPSALPNPEKTARHRQRPSQRPPCPGLPHLCGCPCPELPHPSSCLLTPHPHQRRRAGKRMPSSTLLTPAAMGPTPGSESHPRGSPKPLPPCCQRPLPGQQAWPRLPASFKGPQQPPGPLLPRPQEPRGASELC